MYNQQQIPYGYYPSPQNSYMRQPAPSVQQTSQMMLKGRPVSSVDEVRASVIDFDGSIFYFPDIANRKIYTKQIGLDGSAILCMYELKELPPVETQMSQSNFVTREEFDSVIQQLRQAFAEPVHAPTPAQPEPTFNF